MQYKFIKNTTTGGVHIASTTPPMRDIYLQPNCTIKPSADYQNFSLFDSAGKQHTFTYSEISAYQIDSDPEVSTTGLPLRDFLAVLAQSFFFESVGGGNSGIITGELVLSARTSYDVTVSPSHNIVIPNLATSYEIEITDSVGAGFIITGIDSTGVADGQEWLMINKSVHSMQLNNNSASSLAANRLLGTGNFTRATNGHMRLRYDAIAQKFRMID